MKTIKWKHLLMCLIIYFVNIQQINSQCEWLYNNLPTTSYDINQGNLVLFFCENSIGQITAPSEYTDVEWNYSSTTGTCESIESSNGVFYFSVDINDPCLEELSNNLLTVTFEGVINNDNSNLDICTFDILFNESGEPSVEVSDEMGIIYNTNEQIIVCENNDITLTASGLGAYPDYTNIQWYVNGDLVPGENTINLNLNNTNYDINQANTFYFSSSNYCSSGSYNDSEWLTITIYEGYDNCDPCSWDLPNYKEEEFYGFCPDCEGDNFFPEKPNNELNRSTENTNRIPTCEATIYKVSIYNRLGRKIFESEYDNHPWDGKLNNGKKCKEGTYFYKLEYVLNPKLPENSQNETKFAAGSVFLSWEN